MQTGLPAEKTSKLQGKDLELLVKDDYPSLYVIFRTKFLFFIQKTMRPFRVVSKSRFRMALGEMKNVMAQKQVGDFTLDAKKLFFPLFYPRKYHNPRLL